MPQIIVIADTPAQDGAAHILFRERVTERLFESSYFGRQLAQRIGWAVGDAQAVERRLLAESTETAAHPPGARAADVAAETLLREDVSAETAQRPSARVVTTAS
jgi:hypothetical protein